ncbi:MAG: hypothetical protein B7Z68_07975 [Acidobacteria bacterium 21-70-11]|nr:MAG: hypothetical protein B7Z68_07975 [Acidobacteria bacterium 21-70-11]
MRRRPAEAGADPGGGRWPGVGMPPAASGQLAVRRAARAGCRRVFPDRGGGGAALTLGGLHPPPDQLGRGCPPRRPRLPRAALA